MFLRVVADAWLDEAAGSGVRCVTSCPWTHAPTAASAGAVQCGDKAGSAGAGLAAPAPSSDVAVALQRSHDAGGACASGGDAGDAGAGAGRASAAAQAAAVAGASEAAIWPEKAAAAAAAAPEAANASPEQAMPSPAATAARPVQPQWRCAELCTVERVRYVISNGYTGQVCGPQLCPPLCGMGRCWPQTVKCLQMLPTLALHGEVSDSSLW